MEIVFAEWKLRTWERSDISSLVKYANNSRIWQNVRDLFPHPYTEADGRYWIQLANEPPATNFAIASRTEAIGGIGFTIQADIHRRSAEVGYWLGEPYWGRGIATKALAALVNYAFTNFNLIRLYASVFESNLASARVLEKNGFKLEGRLAKSITKNGETFDSLLYALIKEE